MIEGQDAIVLDLRTQGRTRREIAETLGVPIKHVDESIQRSLDEVREGNEDLVEEMFHLHVCRLEKLFSLVYEALTAATSFDDRLYRVALQILERQARLLALDKRQTAFTDEGLGFSRSKSQRWLQDATPSELISEIESYGIKVPEKFKLPGTPKALRAAPGVLAAQALHSLHS